MLIIRDMRCWLQQYAAATKFSSEFDQLSVCSLSPRIRRSTWMTAELQGGVEIIRDLAGHYSCDSFWQTPPPLDSINFTERRRLNPLSATSIRAAIQPTNRPTDSATDWLPLAACASLRAALARCFTLRCQILTTFNFLVENALHFAYRTCRSLSNPERRWMN